MFSVALPSPYITFSFLGLFLLRKPECFVAFCMAFIQQWNLATSFLAFTYTLLTAALVILSNTACHIALLLTSSCGVLSCSE